jgi:hypothetical protein
MKNSCKGFKVEQSPLVEETKVDDIVSKLKNKQVNEFDGEKGKEQFDEQMNVEIMQPKSKIKLLDDSSRKTSSISQTNSGLLLQSTNNKSRAIGEGVLPTYSNLQIGTKRRRELNGSDEELSSEEINEESDWRKTCQQSKGQEQRSRSRFKKM